MASDHTYGSRPSDVALTLRWAGRSRSLRMNRWIGGALLGLIPLLAIWYLGATLYVVFHDRLLASLMARQTDMQYAYEDRIAALKTELDRETSRALIDRHTLDTTIRELGERGARLEARAATIDSLVVNVVPGSSMARSSLPLAKGETSTPPAPRADIPSDLSVFDTATPFSSTKTSQPASPDLRLEKSMDSSSLQESYDGDAQATRSRMDRLATALSRVEDRQAGIVARLRDPAIRAVERMQLALADTGLPLSRWQGHSQSDIGGPFVPLPSNANSVEFGQSVQLVRDAATQYDRLSAIIDRVPLRQPVDGPLEVTSTFGARLDPFFGRPAMHTGIDLHETYGDKVAATATGIVTIAGSEGGYGTMVEIDHGGGLTTRYAHLASTSVSVNQRVAVGDIVGKVGMTGRTTGPHLHYETRINGEPVNPVRFLKAGAALFAE